jgi:hypothetical protein
MSSEEQVRSALKALAEQDRSLESSTPASAIFAQRRVARRETDRRWLWLTGVAAAAAMALFAWTQRPAQEPKVIPVVVVNEGNVAPQVETKPVAQVASVEQPKPKPVRRVKRTVPPPEPPEEIVTEFFPLMDAPPPFERGQLVRMLVPASTMRTVGLPIAPERWNDRVQADVLVGEEGMARAIRFVSFTQ